MLTAVNEILKRLVLYDYIFLPNQLATFTQNAL